MATHQDKFANETQHAQQEQVDEFRTFNSESTDEIVISHPSGGREKIELQKPLLVALARENRSKVGSDDSSGSVPPDEIFDHALCDVTSLALRSSGICESKIADYKLRALMIRIARDLNSFQELAEYVSQYSTAKLEEFGLRAERSGSTYRKAAKHLKQRNQFESLIDACFIAVHALFWNGVPIPEPVRDRYELSYDLEPAASNYSEAARKVALYNLAEDLLQVVTAHLDLQRDGGGSRDLRSLLGVFAYTARHDESIENYGQTASHKHDLGSALNGSTVRGHIDELALWQVEEMFDNINQALLEYVIESGVVDKPVVVSYDLTEVQSLGLSNYDGTFRTADGRWRFASLSFTDPSLDFSFGLRLLKSEGQRARVLRTFLRNLTSVVDVKLFMADRGFDGREDIEACRTFVPGSWIICAQDYSESHGKQADYARLREKLDPGSTAIVENAGYEDLHPPVRLIGYSGANKDENSIDPVRAFYTGMELPTDDEKREKIITNTNFRYNQRAKIEPLFRMAKNRFDVFSDTDDPVRKVFYFNTSILFCNLYNVLNTVPSPRHGLELDTTQNEVLEVIENLAFHGPTTPDALRYHREHY